MSTYLLYLLSNTGFCSDESEAIKKQNEILLSSYTKTHESFKKFSDEVSESFKHAARVAELFAAMKKNLGDLIGKIDGFEKITNDQDTDDIEILKAKHVQFKKLSENITEFRTNFQKDFTKELEDSAEIGKVFDKMVGEFSASLEKLG